MSTEMIIAVSVMAVIFIVVSWILQKNKSKKN
jgi:energy-converting hydrogenase Eha subunit F